MKEQELYHYGILGMKWGHHKAKQSTMTVERKNAIKIGAVAGGAAATAGLTGKSLYKSGQKLAQLGRKALPVIGNGIKDFYKDYNDAVKDRYERAKDELERAKDALKNGDQFFKSFNEESVRISQSWFDSAKKNYDKVLLSEKKTEKFVKKMTDLSNKALDKLPSAAAVGGGIAAGAGFVAAAVAVDQFIKVNKLMDKSIVRLDTLNNRDKEAKTNRKNN